MHRSSEAMPEKNDDVNISEPINLALRDQDNRFSPLTESGIVTRDSDLSRMPGFKNSNSDCPTLVDCNPPLRHLPNQSRSLLSSSSKDRNLILSKTSDTKQNHGTLLTNDLPNHSDSWIYASNKFLKRQERQSYGRNQSHQQNRIIKKIREDRLQPNKKANNEKLTQSRLREYDCQFCDKSFTQLSMLKRHFKLHHRRFEINVRNRRKPFFQGESLGEYNNFFFCTNFFKR